jgi:polysaccharide export outer membrane protein
VTIPLLNDIEAAGLTTEQLKKEVIAAAARLIEDPAVTVAVKEIRSRKVFITGRVERPGVYMLTAPMTVLQLIAMAGGLKEFADSKHIVVTRIVEGKPAISTFNYTDVAKQRRGQHSNIQLQPGDTVVVP